MSTPLKAYGAILNRNLNGRMIELESLARLDGKVPYMTILDHVVFIGPLLVHMLRDGRLMAVDAEKGTVSDDFGGAQSLSARAQLEKECGAMKAGSFVMLWHMRSLNFWHWMMEALPKVLMAEAGGFTGTYIIPPEDPKSPFIGESLALMGVTSQRLVAYDGQPWCLERLYLPQPIEGVDALMDYPKIIETLRSRLLDACKPSPYRLDRIYIARDGDVQRRLINETPLLHSLFKHEFQRVVMENFSLREQIRIASQARCLVAPHGAGMVHSLFMPPGSLVLEIFNANYVNPCMLPAIDCLRHRYFMVPSAGLNPAGTEDITAFIRPIEITLRREIDLQSRGCFPAEASPLLVA